MASRVSDGDHLDPQGDGLAAVERPRQLYLCRRSLSGSRFDLASGIVQLDFGREPT